MEHLQFKSVSQINENPYLKVNWLFNEGKNKDLPKILIGEYYDTLLSSNDNLLKSFLYKSIAKSLLINLSDKQTENEETITSIGFAKDLLQKAINLRKIQGVSKLPSHYKWMAYAHLMELRTKCLSRRTRADLKSRFRNCIGTLKGFTNYAEVVNLLENALKGGEYVKILD